MRIVYLTDLEGYESAPYARLTEAQLRYACDSCEGLFIAESLNVISSALEAGYEPVSLLTEERHLDKIASSLKALPEDVPVYTAPPCALEALTGYRLSRGVLAAMRRKALPSFEDAVKGASRIAVLEGVLDPTNIGAIFRSAAALGMDAVILGSNCCDPLHRRAARVSMGGVFRIPWTVIPCLKEARNRLDLSVLKKEGFLTAAMALDDKAISIDDPALLRAQRLAVILGTEGSGLDPMTVSGCDMTVMIPMHHGVDSLNVAAASAVAFWMLAGSDKKPSV